MSCFNEHISTRSWDVNPHSFPIIACLTFLDENLDVGATKKKSERLSFDTSILVCFGSAYQTFFD